jgi:hypothetical protein
MVFAALGFRQYFVANEESQFDTDACETDALTADLGARRDIWKRASSRRCIPEPLSMTVNVYCAGSD